MIFSSSFSSGLHLHLLPLPMIFTPSSPSSDIKEHVKQIEKAVSGKEPRFVLRALRALPSTSRRLNTNVLHKAICGFFTNNTATRDFLLGFLEEVRSHNVIRDSFQY